MLARGGQKVKRYYFQNICGQQFTQNVTLKKEDIKLNL